MRILLIATNRHDRLQSRLNAQPMPIGLAYIAGHLDHERHQIRVLDLMFSDDHLAEVESVVKEFQPQMVGLSVRNLSNHSYMNTIWALPISKEVIDRIRLISDAIIVCGESETCDLRIVTQSQTKEGLSLSLTWQGGTYEFTVPIFGIHQITNIALVFAVACAYGADPESVALALKSTPQITHRFEVKPGPNGAALVDDAYNSNPEGFASALEALDILVEPDGRRILATPGMVELGEAHDEEHTRLGEIAAAHVDTLLAIAPSRIENFVDAFEQHTDDEVETIRCESFAEANDWIAENAKSGDVVLLENDLPDLYERRLGI